MRWCWKLGSSVVGKRIRLVTSLASLTAKFVAQRLEVGQSHVIFRSVRSLLRVDDVIE